MPITVPTRLRGTSTTTGTGAYATGTSFSSALTSNDVVFYHAIDTATGAWEAGKGTWTTGGALSRTQIIATNTGATTAVSWAAGVRDIVITVNPRGVTSPVGGGGGGGGYSLQPGPYPDDAAAAAAGVPIGYTYRQTSNVVVVRAV